MDLSKLMESDFYKRKMLTFLKSRDANNDGLITRMDFDLIMKRFKDRRVPEEHLKVTEYVFHRFCDDMGLTDETKLLTYQQFTERFGNIAEEASKVIPAFYKSSFKVADANDDGFISLKEWEDYNYAICVDAENSRASFEAMDTNHDGKISLEEFMAYHEEFFFSDEDKLKSSILFGPLVESAK